MKKILLLLSLISTIALSDTNNEVLEKRIENELSLKNKVSNCKVEYDVDISGNKMNLEIELEGNIKKLNYDEIALNAIKIVKNMNNNINDIYVVIKHDPLIGEDEVIFTKSYSN